MIKPESKDKEFTLSIKVGLIISKLRLNVQLRNLKSTNCINSVDGKELRKYTRKEQERQKEILITDTKAPRAHSRAASLTYSSQLLVCEVRKTFKCHMNIVKEMLLY